MRASRKIFEFRLVWYNAGVVEDCLEQRRDNKFMVEDLPRLGLLQEKISGSEAVEERPWETKRLMPSSRNLEVLLTGRYYASHKRLGGRNVLVGVLLYPSSTKSLRQRCGEPDYERFQELSNTNTSLNLVQLKHAIQKQAE